MIDFTSRKTRTLELMKLCQQQVFRRYDIENMDASFDLMFHDYMDTFAMKLRAYVYAGETREKVKTQSVTFHHTKTWVDALQLHMQSKGFLCGGGLVGLLCYWWFLGRSVQFTHKTTEVQMTFRARELFPDIKHDRQPRCVIVDWTEPDNLWSER